MWDQMWIKRPVSDVRRLGGAERRGKDDKEGLKGSCCLQSCERNEKDKEERLWLSLHSEITQTAGGCPAAVGKQVGRGSVRNTDLCHGLQRATSNMAEVPNQSLL